MSKPAKRPTGGARPRRQVPYAARLALLIVTAWLTGIVIALIIKDAWM